MQHFRDPQNISPYDKMLQSVLDDLETGLCLVAGPEYVIQFANASFRALFGNEVIAGTPLREALPNFGIKGSLDLIAEALVTGKAQCSRESLTNAAYTEFANRVGVSINVDYRPIHNHGDGSVALLLLADGGSHNDVVDQGSTTVQRTVPLRQFEKMEALGRLTGGIAHDFNNILQVIAGNLQLLYPLTKGESAIEKRLEAAIGAVERGATLSSQLLAFARRQPLRPVSTNLARIVSAMNESLRRSLGPAIDVRIATKPDLWHAMIDPAQIENTIRELALNARDAMNGAGTLTIDLENTHIDAQHADLHGGPPPGEYVLLSVTDTGHGMAPEDIDNAFEPFYTTKPEGEGSGLGLSMVYGFIKQSGGHIEIDSTPDYGAKFKLYLPRSLEESEHAPVVNAPIEGGDETILIVEDDFDVRATVMDMLAGLGYTVLKADNAESALIILKSGIHVDLLFSDVVMPGPIRSSELARQAKILLPDIQILFTSGYAQNVIGSGNPLDPGVSLLSKPYRREELARKIRAKLSSKKETVFARTAAMAEQLNEASTTVKPGALRILVVEDNTDSRDLVCEMLAVLGYSAQGAGTAEQARDMMVDAEFDVLLTDVNLPGMSGVQLAEHAVQAQPGLRVILASGYGKSIPVEGRFESTMLPKPFDMTQLQDALTKMA